MTELHLPWLELSVLFPLIGAVGVGFLRDRDLARKICVAVCTLALLFAVGEWIDFGIIQRFEAHDQWEVLEALFHRDIFVVDELSSPLLPLVALVYLMTVMATLRTKVSRFSFGWTLDVRGHSSRHLKLPRSLGLNSSALPRHDSAFYRNPQAPPIDAGLCRAHGLFHCLVGGGAVALGSVVARVPAGESLPGPC